MQISKAIEILAYHVQEHDFDPDGETNDAIKLGIQALEAFNQARSPNAKATPYYLPGETEGADDEH